MSKLNDCAGKLRQLLDAVASTEAAYQQARQLLHTLDTGNAVDLSGLGLKLTFDDGTEIPVPMPGNQPVLVETVAGSVNFLATDIGRLWHEINVVAREAKDHYDQAVAASQQQAGAGVPATSASARAVAPMSAPPSVAPPALGESTPTIPRLLPVQTTDVTAQKR